MRIIVLTLAGTLFACGSSVGAGTGAWDTPEGSREIAGPAVAGWCAERGRILVELAHEQGTIGVLWRYAALVPESLGVVISPPDSSVVTPVPSASVALRYVETTDVRGYHAFAGAVQVTAVDSASISATARVQLVQVEGTDTTELAARFDRVPLTVDRTVCER
jgi:hypothetical protein